MRKSLLTLSTLPWLFGCAYAVDKSVQDITIRTPGAVDAVCLMYVDGVRYRMHPPQTTSIARNDEDLIIDCLAPGNRRNKVVIEPTYADSAAGNAATAGVGLAWDHFSGALYKYPDVVEVDFTNTPIGPPSIPAQNNPDIRQPEDYPIEEFKPSQPFLNSDKQKIPTEFLKRGSAQESKQSMSADSFSENASMPSGKGDLKAVVESYGNNLDPSASAAPTPVIPGQ